MTKNQFCILLIVLVFCSRTYSQTDTLPRKYNVGISTGILGIHRFFKPALEVKINKISISGSPGFFYYGVSVDYEFFKLRKTKQHQVGFLLLSTQYEHKFKSYGIDASGGYIYSNSYSVLFGVKQYSKRMSFSIKAGMRRTYTEMLPDETIYKDIIFYTEFKIGMYLLK